MLCVCASSGRLSFAGKESLRERRRQMMPFAWRFCQTQTNSKIAGAANVSPQQVLPGYNPECKRILISSDYLSTLKRPNVHMVVFPRFFTVRSLPLLHPPHPSAAPLGVFFHPPCYVEVHCGGGSFPTKRRRRRRSDTGDSSRYNYFCNGVPTG